MEKAAAAAMEHEVAAVTAGKTKSLQGGLCWQVLRKESSLYMYWAGDVRYGGLGACGMGLRPLGYTQRLSPRLLCVACMAWRI